MGKSLNSYSTLFMIIIFFDILYLFGSMQYTGTLLGSYVILTKALIILYCLVSSLYFAIIVITICNDQKANITAYIDSIITFSCRFPLIINFNLYLVIYSFLSFLYVNIHFNGMGFVFAVLTFTSFYVFLSYKIVIFFSQSCLNQYSIGYLFNSE